jgi:hypothetical protein
MPTLGPSLINEAPPGPDRAGVTAGVLIFISDVRSMAIDVAGSLDIAHRAEYSCAKACEDRATKQMSVHLKVTLKR